MAPCVKSGTPPLFMNVLRMGPPPSPRPGSSGRGGGGWGRGGPSQPPETNQRRANNETPPLPSGWGLQGVSTSSNLLRALFPPLAPQPAGCLITLDLWIVGIPGASRRSACLPVGGWEFETPTLPCPTMERGREQLQELGRGERWLPSAHHSLQMGKQVNWGGVSPLSPLGVVCAPLPAVESLRLASGLLDNGSTGGASPAPTLLSLLGGGRNAPGKPPPQTPPSQGRVKGQGPESPPKEGRNIFSPVSSPS